VQHKHWRARSAYQIARAQAEHSCELGGEGGSGHVLGAAQRLWWPTDLRHNGIACGPRTPRFAVSAPANDSWPSTAPVGCRPETIQKYNL
jgi:hypothetical protein